MSSRHLNRGSNYTPIRAPRSYRAPLAPDPLTPTLNQHTDQSPGLYLTWPQSILKLLTVNIYIQTLRKESPETLNPNPRINFKGHAILKMRFYRNTGFDYKDFVSELRMAAFSGLSRFFMRGKIWENAPSDHVGTVIVDTGVRTFAIDHLIVHEPNSKRIVYLAFFWTSSYRRKVAKVTHFYFNPDRKYWQDKQKWQTEMTNKSDK